MTASDSVLGADQVSAQLEQAHYELTTEGRLARVGLKERQETAPIIARYRHLYTPEQIQALRAEAESTTGARRDELTRLHSALLDGYIDAQSAALSDEVVTSLATATVTVDGASYAFHSLRPAISRAEDPGLRERLLQGMVEVLEPRNDLLARLQQNIETAIRDLGHHSYLGFFATIKRTDYARFATVVARTLEQTQPLYDHYVNAWVQAELGQALGGLSCAHYYWLSHNQAPHDLFPAGRIEETLRATLRCMDIDLAAQTNIHVDAEDRPTKNPRACVFGPRIPGEIHLIIKPVGGKSDYDAFFHEAGHAEHFANVDPSLPYAFRHLPVSMAQLELFSYLMQHLVNDPEWLQAHLQLSPRQAAFVAYRAALDDLALLRRYCAKYLYEYAFFSSGGDGPALYRDELRRHTGFVYPAEFWQFDRDYGFYSADYLRAWLGHAQVAAVLRDRYGSRWWSDPAAGALLRGLWGQGMRPEIEDVVGELGGTPWDTTQLLRYYEERIEHRAGV